MASSSKSINAFELAIILANASRKPEELVSNINLDKLVKALNQFFVTEKTNAGSPGRIIEVTNPTTIIPVSGNKTD